MVTQSAPAMVSSKRLSRGRFGVAHRVDTHCAQRETLQLPAILQQDAWQQPWKKRR